MLLRESYRKIGKVRQCTLANVTHWSADVVDGFLAVLKGRGVNAKRQPNAPEMTIPLVIKGLYRHQRWNLGLDIRNSRNAAPLTEYRLGDECEHVLASRRHGW